MSCVFISRSKSALGYLSSSMPRLTADHFKQLLIWILFGASHCLTGWCIRPFTQVPSAVPVLWTSGPDLWPSSVGSWSLEDLCLALLHPMFSFSYFPMGLLLVSISHFLFERFPFLNWVIAPPVCKWWLIDLGFSESDGWYNDKLYRQSTDTVFF